MTPKRKRNRKKPTLSDIRAKCEIDATNPDSCWLWLKGKTTEGYAKSHGTRGHTITYRLAKGEVPDGLEIDHKCRTRRCVNPEHLEAVTHQVNTLRSPIAVAGMNARKTHCPKGHLYDFMEKKRRDDRFQRRCRTCALRPEKNVTNASREDNNQCTTHCT